MGRITADQSQQLMAILATNVDWSSIDFDALNLQNRVVRNAQEAGRHFEIFIKNGCQVSIGEPNPVLTRPFNPAEFIGEGWTVWKGPADGNGLSGEEDIDPRSLDLFPKIKLTDILLETCLKKGENSISGEEKLQRLKAMPAKVRLGGNIFLVFWEDYNANGKKSALEQLYQDRGITYLDFFGTILRSPRGRRNVLYLCRSGIGEWDWDYGWLGCRWRSGIPSALASIP